MTASKNIAYADYRSQMQDGDVLLFRGTGLISRMIRARTRSLYSHVGIVAWWRKRLMVLEAVGKGVRAIPLSTNIRQYHGGVDYFRANVDIPQSVRDQMLDFAQLQLGKEYAHSQLFKFAAMHLLGMDFSQEKDDDKKIAGQYFCSQYVSDIYARHGYDLAVEVGNHYTSPEVLAESPLLDFVGTLKASEQ